MTRHLTLSRIRSWPRKASPVQRVMAILLAVCVGLGGWALAPLVEAAPVNVVYAGGFANGWEKPQYGSGSYTTTPGGPIELDFGAYNYAKLVHAPISEQQTLRFQFRVVNGFDPANQSWYLYINHEQSTTSNVTRGLFFLNFTGKTPNAGGFYSFEFDLRPGNLGGLPIDTIIFQAGSTAGPGLAAGTVAQINNIEFDGPLVPVAPYARIGASTAPTAETRDASITCAPGRSAINPNIYGIAMYSDINKPNAPEQVSIGATSRRWGGNSVSRYNMTNNASNTGSDYYFQNLALPISLPQFITKSAQAGQSNAITVPAINWIAKDTTAYSYPRSAYAPGQSPQASDPYFPDKTNGVIASSGDFIGANPSATSTANSPARAADLVTGVRAAAGASSPAGRVDQYIIDNEPDGWAGTHRDVRRKGTDPGYVSYEEAVQIAKDYSAAIRAVDPNAQIAGPALQGYIFELFSARDITDPTYAKTDFINHGNTEFLKWYIQQIKNTPARTIDVIDVHHYPAAQNGIGALYPSGPLTVAAFNARIASVRSLWDPTYADNDYVGQGQLGPANANPRVIPRVRGWINDSYGNPTALGVSIGEWNFGQEDHMSGAIATSEALGVFGRERITSAYYWTVPPENSPSFWGFRAFTNYDGAGSRFLPYGLVTSTATDGTSPLSVFASTNAASTENEITAVVINKSPDKRLTTSLSLNGCATMGSAKTYRYDGTNVAGFSASNPQGVNGNKVSLTMEPWTINVVKFSLASVPLPPVNTVAPAIGGSTLVGQTLTATPGTWNPAPATYTYQWQRCDTAGANCVDISGATAPTYTITAVDLNARVQVVVAAANGGGIATALSIPTAVIGAAAAQKPTLKVAPVISGLATVGSTLTATDGTWDNAPTTFIRSWQRCNGPSCQPIAGAAANTYVLTTQDLQRTVKFSIAASNIAGSASADSAFTAVVTPGLVKPTGANTGVPTGVRTTSYSGPTTITTSGTVIDAKKITSPLYITANNVTIRRSKVLLGSSSCCAAIQVKAGVTGTKIVDTEIAGGGIGLCIYGNDMALTRVNISGCQYGVGGSTNVSVQSSYIHDTTDASLVGIYGTSMNGWTITGNSLSSPTTCTFTIGMTQPAPATVTNINITGNWLAGGTYTIGVDGTAITFNNNRFIRGSWAVGPRFIYITNPPPTGTGNVYDDDGSAVGF
jgi:Glycoside hydrolase family 44